MALTFISQNETCFVSDTTKKDPRLHVYALTGGNPRKTSTTRWCYVQAERQTSQFGNWGRRVAHTMHCTVDKGCVSPIFTINFQLSGNLWEGSSGAFWSFSSCISRRDWLRVARLWPETSASGSTNPKHWITQSRLYEGDAQPNGGLADTLVYGNRHRGFWYSGLDFFLYDGDGAKGWLFVMKRQNSVDRLVRCRKLVPHSSCFRKIGNVLACGLVS